MVSKKYIWDEDKNYRDLLHKRAIGELDEMESSKALCKIMSRFYKNNMRVLDVGCGVGHYLRSFRLRLDKNIDYTGLDSAKSYIQLARKIFGEGSHFVEGDIHNLPFKDNSFDVVVCNNVILHLPPPPIIPISELIRVSSKYVVIRVVIGKRNYIIKEILSRDDGLPDLPIKEGSLIDRAGDPFRYNYFNMYTEQYFLDIISEINNKISIKFFDDDTWNYFDNTALVGNAATRIMNGIQVAGNLLLDWRFIVLNKKNEN